MDIRHTTPEMAVEVAIALKELKSAITGSLVSRGRNKGLLKAKCPPMNTPEAAAWQAITSIANPYKLGFGHMLFMTKPNRQIYDLTLEVIKASKWDVRAMDRDRLSLEGLGVW